MELSGLLSGVDNLFKFLFLGGVLIFILSMVYPMQKKQEIDIEIINYNKDIELLNNEISNLHTRVEKFELTSKDKVDLVCSLGQTKKTTTDPQETDRINSEIEAIKEKYNTELSLLEKDKLEIDVKNIILKYNKSKIETLKNHSSSYNSYSNWLFYLGIVFGILGLIGWSISTFNTEILKRQEIKKSEKSTINGC